MPEYCNNPNCKGGIGPHLTEECPNAEELFLVEAKDTRIVKSLDEARSLLNHFQRCEESFNPVIKKVRVIGTYMATLSLEKVTLPDRHRE